MSARQFQRARQRRIEREGKRDRVSGKQKAALAAGAGLGATVLFAPAAEAATFTVTNLDDAGAGSLRQAVLDANGAGGDDIVTFQAGLTGTITLTTGEIAITETLEIQGPGADVIAVSGNSASRVFYAEPAVADQQVLISGLTMTQGDTTGDGGAVLSQGETFLTIADSVVSDSHADDDGGGVYSDGGELVVTGSYVRGNSADDTGGGLVLYDTDGAYDPGEYEGVIRDTVVTDNTAPDGGGIYFYDLDGPALIERTTVAGNTATDDGGGLWLYETDGIDQSITIRDSTVSGNEAIDNGGGIYLYDTEGPVVLENSTVSSNTAGGDGGGIFVLAVNGEPFDIQNATITGNSADGDGAGIYRDEDRVGISSSIVAGNSGEDLAESATATEAFEVSFSLIGDQGSATTTDLGNNIFGADPQLGPLAANGGPTQTHLPALASPAVDAGIANGLATDQRGLARISDLVLVANATGSDASDIGSVELQSADVEGDCQGQTVARINGTEADDALTGTEGPDLISGLAGNDTASAAGGDDCVSGGGGNDSASGGGGKDLLTGEGGKDKLSGQGGKDNAKGGGGKDNLKGGGGKDKLNAGGGKDRLSGGGGKDKLKGGPGKDRIKTGGGKDKVNCGGGEDKVSADPKDKVAKNCETVT